jgi:hypothetical protein
LVNSKPPAGSRITWLCLWLLMLGVGCQSTVSPVKLRDSEAAYDAGIAALGNKDWATAESELSEALSGPGLQPDLHELALLARVRARVELGNLEGAAADIAVLEQGAAAMDQVLSLKSQLLLKQGDAAAAKQTFLDAKKLNPKLAAPAGL